MSKTKSTNANSKTSNQGFSKIKKTPKAISKTIQCSFQSNLKPTDLGKNDTSKADRFLLLLLHKSQHNFNPNLSKSNDSSWVLTMSFCYQMTCSKNKFPKHSICENPLLTTTQTCKITILKLDFSLAP
jgi:hypothetical protein